MKIKSIGSNQTEIIKDNGTIILISYETPVACFTVDDGYCRTEERYSTTTTKHINKWLEQVKATIKPQSFFDKLL